MAKKFWQGSQPDRCNICGDPITLEFVDGKTKQGPWGIMCLGCHAANGVGLGLGKGQRYKLIAQSTVDSKGKWQKVEG